MLYLIQEEGAGPRKDGHIDNIREGMKEYSTTEEMTDNRSVWHMKIKTGSLLHGGGLHCK